MWCTVRWTCPGGATPGAAGLVSFRLLGVEPLRVNPVGLRKTAGDIETLGGQLAGARTAPPPAAAGSWQSSVPVAATAHAGASADETVLANRMRATATKIGVAAATYTTTDTATASTLSGQVV